MKKRIFLLFLLTVVLLSMKGIYAEDGKPLDAEKVVIGLMGNSQAMKSASKSYENAYEQYSKVQKAAVSSTSAYLNKFSSEYNLNACMRALDVQSNSIRIDGYTKYIALLKAKNNAEIQQVVVKQAEEAYKDAKFKLDMKLATEEELLDSQAQYQKARLQLQIGERNLKALLASLNASMGERLMTEYTSYIDYNLVPEEKVASLQEYTEAALGSRADILNPKGQLKLKRKEQEYAAATHPDKEDDYYLQLDYDLSAINSQLETAEIDVRQGIERMYQDLQTSMRSLEGAQKAMQEAEEGWKLAQMKYDMGVINKSSKAEVQLTYIKAQNDYKSAQLDAWLMQAKMNCAMGSGL
jgi:outer membrane protein TolC